jgi:hypothetical protein
MGTGKGHFIRGHDVETDAACLCRDEENKHLWIFIEFIDRFGT